MSGKENIEVGGISARAIKLDNPEALAGLLNSLLGVTPEKISGADLLSQCPPAIPGDGPEDAEWKAKHMARTHAMVDELSKLDMSKVDTLVIGWRLTNGEDGFFLGGGHLGTGEAIQALMVHMGDKLIAELDADNDPEEHNRRVAAGETPCPGCGKFHG